MNHYILIKIPTPVSNRFSSIEQRGNGLLKWQFLKTDKFKTDISKQIEGALNFTTVESIQYKELSSSSTKDQHSRKTSPPGFQKLPT